MRAVETSKWKYIRRFPPTDPRELYDLEADAGETVNLIVSSRHAEIVTYFGHYLDEEALNTVCLSRTDFVGTAQLITNRQYEEVPSKVTPKKVTPKMLQVAITGSPQDAIRKIQMLAEAGTTQVSVGGPLGPDPKATVRLFGEQIIPYFRS